jgi:hypothetical protein
MIQLKTNAKHMRNNFIGRLVLLRIGCLPFMQISFKHTIIQQREEQRFAPLFPVFT